MGGTIRALVCDDDHTNRTVITDLLEERGVQVLAETDRASDAIELLDRFGPDLVVCDMALAAGTGMDVIEHLGETGARCRVVVFTAFEDMTHPVAGVAVHTVVKPDFAHLERALDDAIAAAGEDGEGADRRRPVRPVAPPSMRSATGLDDAAEFYRELSEASAGDVLLAVAIGGADDIQLGDALRTAIRAQDLLIRRHEQYVMLLIGGGDDAAESVLRRVRAITGSTPADARWRVIDPATNPPLETLLQLQQA